MSDMDTVERAAVAKDDFVTPDLTKNKTKDTVAIAHDDRAVWENREPYGPAGANAHLKVYSQGERKIKS
jgi:hypothetical protein